MLQRRNIEILKIRFGEAALQVCEVMLKDMTDSKRIDGHVQSQTTVSSIHILAFHWVLLTILVYCTPHHYITSFLANLGNQ